MLTRRQLCSFTLCSFTVEIFMVDNCACLASGSVPAIFRLKLFGASTKFRRTVLYDKSWSRAHKNYVNDVCGTYKPYSISITVYSGTTTASVIESSDFLHFYAHKEYCMSSCNLRMLTDYQVIPLFGVSHIVLVLYVSFFCHVIGQNT